VAASRARSTNIAGISCLSLIVSEEREIREIMRLRRDGARIYPTVAFEAQPSEYIPRLRSEAADEARPQSAARLIAKRKTTSERLSRMIADSSATANDQLLHLHLTTIKLTC
jgi:hypothetical protein